MDRFPIVVTACKKRFKKNEFVLKLSFPYPKYSEVICNELHA